MKCYLEYSLEEEKALKSRVEGKREETLKTGQALLVVGRETLGVARSRTTESLKEVRELALAVNCWESIPSRLDGHSYFGGQDLFEIQGVTKLGTYYQKMELKLTWTVSF